VAKAIADRKAIDDAAKAKAIDDAAKAKAIDDAAKAKAIDDAVKAKAIDDAAKAKAIDDAAKAKAIDDAAKAKAIADAATAAHPVPAGLIPLLPPPPPSPAGGSSRLVAIAAQAAADALSAGSSVMTTSTTTGMQTLLNPIPNVDPLAGAKGGADPNTVMVAGPKMAIDVGNFPEYDAIKAKNNGAELTMKDYRDILKQVATDFPNLFTKDLEKAKTATGKIQKVETYVNNLNKADLGAYSKKILIEKYKLNDATIKFQEVSERSVLSREYGNTKIATHELQNVMRRGIAANKYKDILTATIHQEKQISSATRIQTNYRSKLARQAFAREVFFAASPSGAGTPLSNVYDASAWNEAEFNAFFGP